MEMASFKKKRSKSADIWREDSLEFSLSDLSQEHLPKVAFIPFVAVSMEHTRSPRNLASRNDQMAGMVFYKENCLS